MGYKVFYSFQTDTDSKLNLGFIRKAIEKAIKNIKEFDIDPLIEGFRGVGGNTPLLETMLNQSAKADVFIGDVTYTSSKIWQSKGIGFFQDANQYFIEIDKPLDLKPAPNPNVLLEMGYSWGRKNFERTILVMNEAFGNPSLLPVDMKGLRWPITYNLSLERVEDLEIKAKEFKDLSKALEGAIRTAINSSFEYQERKLSPMYIYRSWARNQRGSFIITPKIEKILTDLRSLVTADDKACRFIGPPNVGKSRILFELFRKNGGLQEVPEQMQRIIYHDLAGPLKGDISKQLHQLISDDQHKILILDNCPKVEIKSYEKLFRGSRIKLLTVCSDSLNMANEYIITIDDSIEISKEILVTKFPYNKAEELANELKGNISKVILNLSENVSLEGQISSLELVKQEIGDGNVEKGAIELLTNFSLFKFMGTQGEYEHELHCFLDNFYPGTELAEIKTIIDILVEHNLIVRNGDFIQVEIENEELIYEWWKKLDLTKIETIHSIDHFRLLNKLSQQLLTTHKNISIPDLENNLFGPNKFLRKGDYYLTRNGQRFLNDLAPLFPERVLELSEEIVNSILK